MIRQARTWTRRFLAGFVTIMAASSHLAYTTAGFDFEAASPTGVDVYYYRLRWDDGSTWGGHAVQPVGRSDRPLEWFDPGGTILAPPSRPHRPTWWNRRGFWWITRASDDPYVALRYPGARASRWVAVPSWLVVAAVWAPEWISAGRWLIARLTVKGNRPKGS